ncbi:ORF7 [Chimpanzee stool associated circular ssDNA virus]|nr:ORF7 [Chimpanzee stool associated circular ssDNA virus]
MGHRARRRQRRIRALAGQMQCPGRSGQRLDSIPKSGIWMARTNLNLDRGMFRQIHLRDQGRQILGIMGYDGSKATAVRENEMEPRRGRTGPTADERPRDSSLVRRRRQHGQIVALRAPIRDRAGVLHTAVHDKHTKHDSNGRITGPTGPGNRVSPAPPHSHRHSEIVEMEHRAIHGYRSDQGRANHGPEIRSAPGKHTRHKSDRANKHQAQA